MLFSAASTPDTGKLQSRAERCRSQGVGMQGARLDLVQGEGWQADAGGRQGKLGPSPFSRRAKYQ